MAEAPTPLPPKNLLPTDWYPMNRKRRHTHHPASSATPSTPTTPPPVDFAHHHNLDAQGESPEDAETVNNNIDEFIYMIGDAGQKMLIAGITSVKHSAEDIAVAFQNYWFSDAVEGGKALKCDELVISKAFKSIEDGSKNTWFFRKFSKGGGGYEEALGLLEVGICCAYGEAHAVEEEEEE